MTSVLSADLQQLFDRAFAPLEAAVAAKRIPGGVLGIVDKNGHRIVRAIGSAQLVPKQRPMTVETWFDLASLTKVIFTTPRILALAEDGVIDLDAPLISVLPDLRQYDQSAWERKVTFRQCLGHQTPFPAVEPIYTYGRDPELLRAFILQREWRAREPVYSDINFILLGFALERLSARTIRDMTLAALFIAQATNIHLSMGDQILLLLVAMLSSKGAAGITGAGFITLAATLSVVPSVPVAGMARCRMVASITGCIRSSPLAMPPPTTRTSGE